MLAIAAFEREASWWADAACADGTGNLTELFFSEQLDDIARAKAICAGCPVRERCLEQALERREPWGVWGGELFLNGRILAQKRKRGRPPKRPRPDTGPQWLPGGLRPPELAGVDDDDPGGEREARPA